MKQDENKIWMSSGKGGCTFMALFAKAPEKVGWVTIEVKSIWDEFVIPKDAFTLSIQFPYSWGWPTAREWAKRNGFIEEPIMDGYIGLRYQINGLIAWVQYFGPDSHVKTRQAPRPELMLCVKLSSNSYFKVGFNGVLHLAHASIRGIGSRIADKLWETSHNNTTKQLGKPAGKEEASKVTFKIK